jgi:hypothetical protein
LSSLQAQRPSPTANPALTLLEEVGDRAGQASTWNGLGYAHHRLGHHTRAVTCYQNGLQLERDIGNRYLEARTLDRLGDAHHTAGNRRDADADVVRAKLTPAPARGPEPGHGSPAG